MGLTELLHQPLILEFDFVQIEIRPDHFRHRLLLPALVMSRLQLVVLLLRQLVKAIAFPLAIALARDHLPVGQRLESSMLHCKFAVWLALLLYADGCIRKCGRRPC